MKARLAWLAAAAIILIGCAGENGPSTKGIVRGIVMDSNGDAVRDALVYVNDDRANLSALTNSNGVYEIGDVPTGDRIIRAEASQNGVNYRGSNVARVLVGEPTETMNVAVYRTNQLASLHGTVRDRFGDLIQGARVFVKQQDGATLTSSYAITDRDGNYRIIDLSSTQTYSVQVNALDFNSNFGTLNLSAGEDKRLDFNLPDGENVTLPAPTGVVTFAWTSPPVGRSKGSSDYLQVARQLMVPQYATSTRSMQSSGLVSGGIIEIDTLWDEVRDSALLGYGIYRRDPGGSSRSIYFQRDPQSEFFADMDVNLRVGDRYTYNVTSVSVTERESVFSTSSSITPLGNTTLRSPINGAFPTLRWDATTLATKYWVYLYDRYPTLNITPVFSTGPIAATEATVSGSPLASGSYYYFVIAGSNEGAFSVSPVDRIIVP